MPAKKICGLSLFSAGCGMMIVIIIPWWGFLVSIILLAIGGFLLFADRC